MITRLFMITVLLVTSFATGPARSIEYIEVEHAYEVNASQIRIPKAGTGTLRVETCKDCKMLRFRLTSESRAFVNDQPVSIKQFRNLAIANDAAAYVFYTPGTFEITRLVLDMPGFN